MLKMDTIVMNLIGWVDCLSHLDTNVKDGYECYKYYIGWVFIVYLWIQNLRMDTNVMNLI